MTACAGVKGVFCEKPFAMSGQEARDRRSVGRDRRTDLGWRDAYLRPRLASRQGQLGRPRDDDSRIRSSILPPNPRFEDFA